ncbi:MAG: riboflavin biosynthesis protein RibF [Planctomycetales bacterium 12-60-4]|nr:MAG: riboflavin biosynthesis protein RibF [Planctomycetales bacterium 12-60-4]
MQLFTSALPTTVRGSFVAIGNFDGVHRGHQAMVERLLGLARRHDRPAIVVTFDPHPLALLRSGGAPPGLTTVPERVELLRKAGVDDVVVLATSPELLQLTAERFFEQVVQQELHAAGLVEGPNFCFGKDRGDNITILRHLCQAHGVSLDVIDPVTWKGQWVSSSAIRSLLIAGDLDSAVDLLGHPYRLTGLVTRGAERGRTLGVPTANLAEIATVLPGFGVYAGKATVSGHCFPTAVNIGPNPTFGEGATKIEAHIIDFTGDLYDQALSIDLTTRLRDIRKFSAIDELKQQLADDIAAARSAS